MKELSYVLFDNYNTLQDFNLYIQKIEISDAEIKSEVIDIPGADGELDFTESLTGEVKYKNRKISIQLSNLRKQITWLEYSKIQNALHGKRMKIILSNDSHYYYIGRVKLKAFKYENFDLIRNISIECDVEAYKYDIVASNEDWEWDSFDFEEGIINETNELIVNEELEITIIGKRKTSYLNIDCSNAMIVEFNDITYNLSQGKQEVLEIKLVEGENKLKFIGNGIITIYYRGGSL